jgi:hypothetical protein
MGLTVRQPAQLEWGSLFLKPNPPKINVSGQLEQYRNQMSGLAGYGVNIRLAEV